MLTSRRVEVSQAIDAMYEEMYEWGWTDGLPVIPPTEERVRAFVDCVGREPTEVVAEIPPVFGKATIEKIAVNAVMAGCRPEYMPVLLAAIEAVTEPAFNLNGIQCTTSPATPMLIINGPIRHRLGINCKSNALGQGSRANATIGRALRLVLTNAGGAIPGAVDKSTLGQPGKFTMCIGENEEENPWEPLHVERGLSSEENAVTVVSANGTFNITSGQQCLSLDNFVAVIAHSISAMGSTNMMCSDGEVVIILCPSHAGIFAKAGLSKQDVKRILWEQGRLPIGWFPAPLVEEKHAVGVVVDGMVPLVRTPNDLIIVVAGGPGLHSAFVPTWHNTTVAIAKPIRLQGRVAGQECSHK